MEHRWGIRHLLDVSVRLEGLPSFARLRNVSLSGAYLETRAAPALDSRVLHSRHVNTGRAPRLCRLRAK